MRLIPCILRRTRSSARLGQISSHPFCVVMSPTTKSRVVILNVFHADSELTTLPSSVMSSPPSPLSLKQRSAHEESHGYRSCIELAPRQSSPFISDQVWFLRRSEKAIKLSQSTCLMNLIVNYDVAERFTFVLQALNRVRAKRSPRVLDAITRPAHSNKKVLSNKKYDPCPT
jgi:hypothetical protein